MGGSNTFNKALNSLKIKKKKPPNVVYGTWLASEIGQQSRIYLFYIIHATSALGFDSFFFESQQAGDLIQRYVDALAPYLQPLENFNVVMVFEAGGSRQNAKKSRILNNGIRNVFLKRFTGSTPLGKKAISRAAGVPPLEIQSLLSESLQDEYGFDCVCSNSTADKLIFQMANTAQSPCFVYSVDQDYLVYSQFVRGLIGPKLSNRFLCLRSDVLDGFGLSSEQLIWCYCAAGSDDVTGIPKVGFKKALQLIQNNPTISSIGIAGNADLLLRIASYMNLTFQEPGIMDSYYQSPVSRAHEFIFETKSDGSRVRLLKLAFDDTNNLGIRVVQEIPSQGGLAISHHDFNLRKRLEMNNVDRTKAANSRIYSFQVPPNVPDDVDMEPTLDVDVDMEPTLDVDVDMEPTLPVQAVSNIDDVDEQSTSDEPPTATRQMNQDRINMFRDRSLHMLCTRNLGTTVKNLPEGFANEFNEWLVNELQLIKVYTI